MRVKSEIESKLKMIFWKLLFKFILVFLSSIFFPLTISFGATDGAEIVYCSFTVALNVKLE